MTITTTELMSEDKAGAAAPKGKLPKRAATWPRWAALAILLAAAGGGWYYMSHRAPEVHYTTTPVQRGRVASRVTATGTLSALVTVQVGSQVSGRVAQLMVDYNSPVHKGQVLAKIDPQLFQSALEQAQANYQSAAANLEKARVQAVDADRQADRQQALVASHFVPVQDRDTAVANAGVAHAQVTAAASALDQAKASLHQAQINLGYTTIVSPINGVVISRSVDVGQTVAASLSAPTIFVLAEDLQKVQVDTSVAEADVGRLKAGMPARFTVDAFPNQTFEGKVRQVRNAATTVQNVVTYDAVIDVANPKLLLKPGMTANVTFTDAQRNGVLRVPNTALRYQPPEAVADMPTKAAATSQGQGQGQAQGGSRTGRRRGGSGGAGGTNFAARRAAEGRSVWVLTNGKPEQRKVQTGISDGTNTEITGGNLHEGDQVITDQQGGATKAPGAGGGGRLGGPRGMF